jgi:hypothetical protein
VVSLFAMSGNLFPDQHPQSKKYHPEVQPGTGLRTIFLK